MSRRGFEAITGSKREWWLVQTVGLLVTAVGVGLIGAAARDRVTPELKAIATGCAASLAAIDVVHVARGRIATTYLADVVLRDGTHLLVDPLSPEDREELREGIEHLSPDSRYRRFFTPVTDVSDRQLTYLTTLDHDQHEALAAVDPDTGRGIAVARYVLVSDAPMTAEVALAVFDEWQGKGVGRALLQRLATVALRRGIVRFTGLMLAGKAR